MGENRPVTSTNLRIRIDGSAGSAAPYEQLRAQIADRARSGALPAGYKLPTVRGLAEELGLAANTVAKAYRALEADGLIETRGRNGTFVAAAEGSSREAAAAAQAFAERVHRLGLTEAEAVAAAAEAVRARYAAT
ncbi:GntR family transcriptional regulator [Streptomyces sp. WAC07149]|nr:GntR family transcriptional regulator [Streptomyces sp. WAC07149]